MKSILVIDDNEEFRSLICNILLDAQYDVWDAACPDQAFSLLKKEQVDLIVCDLQMPFTMGEDYDDFPFSVDVGLKTIKELGAALPQTPIVAVTGLPELVIEKIRTEITSVPVLGKPIRHKLLLGTIEHALKAVPQFVH